MRGFKPGVFATPLLLYVTWLFLSCNSQPNFKTVDLAIGGQDFRIELAISQEEQSRGLMYRKSLDENHGMLFIYDHDQRLSFWMKNTSIPLSIGFINAQGVLREVHDMQPYSTSSVQSRHSVRYALELNRGVFDRLGLGPGDRVFDPEKLQKLLASRP